MDKLSITMESYLDTIYELSEKCGTVRLTDIAIKTGVTKSTANAAMNTLAERSLIQNERYRQICLTESGKVMAKNIAEKHDTIRRFFIEVLKLDSDIADSDACAIEHIISVGAVGAMRDFLGVNQE
ncbi:metal-dependent transcriptional regulator [Lachnospiraceae bacterium ZAX-1]